jgi:hypothetical protein
VFVVVGKAFGVTKTQRDPETGVYHVLSAAEQSHGMITLSPLAGRTLEELMAQINLIHRSES